MIDIKVNRIHKLDNGKNMKAFADIIVNDEILIKGLRILSGKNGLFVSMPRIKGNDNKWYETVRTMTDEARHNLASIVLEAYNSPDA